MSALPSPSPEHLEQRAHEQRQRIHRTALELVSKVEHARQRLTPAYNVRRHFLTSVLIASAIAMVSGYLLAKSWMNRD
jgi:ElaB/YqjD/DUF883 family membrane-anchored ribosome-binding protein